MIVKHCKLILTIMFIVNITRITSNQTPLNELSSPQHQNLTINDIIHIISKKIIEMGIPGEGVDNDAFWDNIHDNIIISAKAIDINIGEQYSALIVDGVIKNVKEFTISSHPTYRRYQQLHRKVLSSTQQDSTESKTLNYYNPFQKKSSRIIEKLNRKEGLVRNITEKLLHTLHAAEGLRSQEKKHISLTKTVDVINNYLLQTTINVQNIKANINNTLTRRSSNNIDCDCDCISNYFCTKIKSLSNSKCTNSIEVLDIDDICDAKVDCGDWSDENLTICGDLILKKIQQSNDYVEDLIFLANYCRISLQSQDMMIESLKKILDIQTKYLNKFIFSRRMNWHLNKAQALNQAAKLIKELGNIIDETICEKILKLNITTKTQEGENNKHQDNIDKNTKNVNVMGFNIIRRRFTNDNTLFKGVDDKRKPKQFPYNCECSRGICSKGCDTRCSSFCERQFQLGKVVCYINDMEINVYQLCDGVVDCIDGGDESCHRTVFKADYIEPTYIEIINLIENKLLHEVVDNTKLREFYNHVKLLLKLMKNGIKDEQFTKLRNLVFADFPVVYAEVVRQITNYDKEDEIFNNLMVINEKLVTTLKNYRNGYSSIDISSKTCVCAHNHCAMPNCDKICNVTCADRGMFLRFSCAPPGNIEINEFVPIHSICNGKSDCTNGFDEADCKKGRCQRNDLLYIKQYVQNITFCESKNMTLMFDNILAPWVNKNVVIIDDIINVMHPSINVLKHVIKTTITELASTFATLNEEQRNDKTIRMKFVDASQSLLRYLKNCDS